MYQLRTAILVTVGGMLALLFTAMTPVLGIPAFPGAEGFGSDTPGGRGGRVIEVTNLDSDGPGSFREACYSEGPRIVVFRVAGIIDLNGGMSIRNPYITIAGQTAPGDGVCLTNGVFHIGTHDVVVRYLRVRPGDGPRGGSPENRDCIDISGDGDRVYNVILDHCSVSWGIDENIATWYGPRDLTIQWCITAESLNDSLHPKGPHGKGMILGSQDNTESIHHCLFAHNMDRNALIGDTGKGLNKGPSAFDFRNNLIYNHGRWACTNVRGTSRVNYVGNYIKIGPDGDPNSPRGARYDASADQLFYVEDNIWPGRPEGEVDDRMVMGGVLGESWAPPPEGLVSATPITVPPVTTESAASVYESVLSFVGATLPVRDVVDARIVEEVRNGDGRIIDTQAEVGGWPEYAAAEPPADSDHDGMPDAWEQQYGLAPDDPADGPGDLDADGYTNVEEYLNATNPTEKTSGAPLPQTEPVLQQGNEHLRYGAARVAPEPVVYDPAEREAFAARVKASGKEVADYLGLELVPIAPGKFVKSGIEVTLTKPFEMSACEVTQAQWTAVMGTKPWLDQEYAQDAPENAVTYVGWGDCQEFVARLNACGEREYRLPTEAEWEYACRAGAEGKSPYWFEEEQLAEFAWYRDNTIRAEEPYAHPVGQKRANPWGLYDMAGNAQEWCHDYYEYWYWNAERKGPTKVDPMGAEPGSYYKEHRVLRGGSFYRTVREILIYPGSIHRPSYRDFDAGFRVVRLAP